MQQQTESSRQYADQYRIHLLLGEGGQANVYLGSLNNQFFALKVFQAGASKEEACKLEANFLKKLNFKYLINMVDYRPFAKVKIHGKSQEKKPMIILEFAEGGDLFDYMSKLGRFNPEVCRIYFKQLLSAIQYLVNQGVTHRDLKPENLLFDKYFCLRVSDFGLSRDAHGNKGDYRLKSKVGTEGYRPPEMNQRDYTGIQADLFAAGVILFVMYTGTPPFLSTEKQDRIYRTIREKNFTRFWTLHENRKPARFYPIEFKRLINSFFSVEIDRRPTFAELQKDEWLNGDEIMINDLKAYMQEKADRITERDPNRQKIASIKKDVYLNKIKEEGECEIQEEQRIGFRLQREQIKIEDMSEEQIFAKDYRKIVIDSQQLPQYTKNKVVYVKENPAFVVAWVKNFLDGEFKANHTFMEDFVSEILPLSYNSSYLAEKHEIKIGLRFQIDEQDETQLIIVGKLHRSDKDEIGIEWQKEEGNIYWLSRVEAALNSSLEGLLL